MPFILRAPLARLFGSKLEFKVLFLGLDASGSTTALYQMKLAQLVATIPTFGVCLPVCLPQPQPAP